MEQSIAEKLNNVVPINEVSEHIALSEKTLRNWRCQGRYPEIFIKLGGKVFVDLKELAEIIESQQARTKTQSRRLGLSA